MGSSILNAHNIRYVVLHKNQLSNKQTNFTNELLQKTLKTEREVYDEDGLIVYRVQNETVSPFMILKDNWYSREEWSGVPTRWISNNATLLIYSNEKVNKNLSLRILSYHNPKNIEIYFENLLFLWNYTNTFCRHENTINSRKRRKYHKVFYP